VLFGVGILLGFLAGQWTRDGALPSHPDPVSEANSRPATASAASSSAALEGELPFDGLNQAVDRALSQRHGRLRLAALYDIGQTVKQADIPEALKLLEARSETEVNVLRNHLLDRWAAEDPQSAMAYAQSWLPLSARESAVQAVLAEWAAGAPDSALAWVNQLPSMRERTKAFAFALDVVAEKDPAGAAQTAARALGSGSPVLDDIIAKWGENDPSSASAWVLNLPSLQARNRLMPRLAGAWAENDPQSAASFALQQPSGRARDSMLEAIAKKWASSDFAAAIGWATNLPNAAARAKVVETACEQCAKADPQRAAKYALSLPEGRAKNNLLAQIAEGWSDYDLQGAESWVMSLQNQDQLRACGAIVSNLVASDPTKAADFAMSISNGTTRTEMLLDLARQWSQQDYLGALAWLTNSDTDFPSKDRAIYGALIQWVMNDASAATNGIQSLPRSWQQKGFEEAIAGQWAADDPSAALAWASSLAPSNGQQQVIAAALRSWANTSPVDAANYVGSLETNQEPAATAVLDSWDRSDPLGAAQWIAEFPPSDFRSHAALDLVTSCPAGDLAALADCIGSLEQGASPGNTIRDGQTDWAQINLDKAANVLEGRWVNLDPTAATEWIQQIFGQPNVAADAAPSP
jgi:hypothetical protein